MTWQLVSGYDGKLKLRALLIVQGGETHRAAFSQLPGLIRDKDGKLLLRRINVRTLDSLVDVLAAWKAAINFPDHIHLREIGLEELKLVCFRNS